MENQSKTLKNSPLWIGKAISSGDFNRLMNQINDDIGKAHVHPNRLHALYLLLTKSKKFEKIQNNKNRVTINSELILSSEHKQKDIFRIVLPDDIHLKNDVSVYSPIGIACLGARENDYVYIKDTNQKLLIEKVFPRPN